jgi:hypothetical protein
MCGDYDNASGNSQFPQKLEYAFDLNVIQVRRRFVSHDERRVLHECSGNRHTLLLAPRELGRSMVGPFSQTDSIKQRIGAHAGLCPADTG